MSTLSDAQRQEVVAFIRAAVKRLGSENRAADELGLSQQLVNKAIRRGEIGIVAVRKMATHLGRSMAGIEPEGDHPTTPPSAPPPSADDDMYPNRAAFLALHGDQISAQTRAFIESIGRSSGDMPLEEWRKMAKQAERDRAAFGVEIKGETRDPDPDGFGDVPAKPKRRR